MLQRSFKSLNGEWIIGVKIAFLSVSLKGERFGERFGVYGNGEHISAWKFGEKEGLLFLFAVGRSGVNNPFAQSDDDTFSKSFIIILSLLRDSLFSDCYLAGVQCSYTSFMQFSHASLYTLYKRTFFFEDVAHICILLCIATPFIGKEHLDWIVAKPNDTPIYLVHDSCKHTEVWKRLRDLVPLEDWRSKKLSLVTGYLLRLWGEMLASLAKNSPPPQSQMHVAHSAYTHSIFVRTSMVYDVWRTELVSQAFISTDEKRNKMSNRSVKLPQTTWKTLFFRVKFLAFDLYACWPATFISKCGQIDFVPVFRRKYFQILICARIIELNEPKSNQKKIWNRWLAGLSPLFQKKSHIQWFW
jgi:hypothetical protein